MGATPEEIRKLLDELEANRRSRRTAWATLQRLRKFLEANGARIGTPDDRNFETEGEAIESGLRRTIEGRDMVMRSLVQAVYRFRDATLAAEKKDDFGNALQNLYRGVGAGGRFGWAGQAKHRKWLITDYRLLRFYSGSESTGSTVSFEPGVTWFSLCPRRPIFA